MGAVVAIKQAELRPKAPSFFRPICIFFLDSCCTPCYIIINKLTEEQKMKIQMITELNEGIYRSDRNAWAVPEEMQATRANLAYLLDWAAYRRFETRGVFGNIGCGVTSVYLITDDGEKIEVVPTNEFEIMNMIPEQGSLSRELINGIRGRVWDGNNNQIFNPIRSERYCAEPDTESYPWGTVTYRMEEEEWHRIDSTTLNPGWRELAWYDRYGMLHTHISYEEMETLRKMGSDTPAPIEEFTDDENDVIALFCRETDFPAIRKFLDEQDAD